MISRENHLVGLLLIFLYCFSSAISMVAVNHYDQYFDPLTLTLYNFIIAAGYFGVLSLFRSKELLTRVRHNIGAVCYIIAATVLAWLTLFYSLKYIIPTVLMGITYASIPITSVLITIFIFGFKSVDKRDATSAAILLAILALVIGYYVCFLPSVVPDKIIYFSLFLGVVCGFGTALCVYFMKMLSVRGFTTVQVMGVRFYLLIIVTAVLMLYFRSPFTIRGHGFLSIPGITLLTIIVPLFLFQKGVERTSAVNVSFIMPLQPVMVYAIELGCGHMKLPPILLALVISLALVIVGTAILKAKSVAAA